MRKTQQPKCVYQVITTEFWRVNNRVEAESPGDALVMYELLRKCGALNQPTRTLLGSIDTPEQVLDANGKLLFNNAPPGDDAERMLFLEMWSRMAEAAPEGDGRTALYVSLRFICTVKQWDPDQMLESIRRRP